MNELSKLINQKVIATIEGEEKNYDIRGIVTGVDVNDFYFYEKGEPFYITISVNPTEEIPNELDIEDFYQISLENIRKA